MFLCWIIKCGTSKQINLISLSQCFYFFLHPSLTPSSLHLVFHCHSSISLFPSLLSPSCLHHCFHHHLLISIPPYHYNLTISLITIILPSFFSPFHLQYSSSLSTIIHSSVLCLYHHPFLSPFSTIPFHHFCSRFLQSHPSIFCLFPPLSYSIPSSSSTSFITILFLLSI